MRMNLTALTRVGKPWFHLLAASPSDATDSLWELERSSGPGVAVRFVRGGKAATVAEFFDEFAAALQFPYYFGENWDAFNDCLCDLEWLRADAVVICVTDALRLLDASPADAKKFAAILQDAARHWNHPAKKESARPFHAVLHTALADEQTTIARWHDLGLTLKRLS